MPIADFELMKDVITNNLNYEDYTVNNFHRHTKKNGEIIYAKVRGNTIQYKGKKAKIVFPNDVIERIHYIQAIKRQNTKLREIGWIHSHLIRGPLARIMGLIDLFRNHKQDLEDLSQILDYVLVSADELDSIVKDITCKAYSEECEQMINLGSNKYKTFVA